MMKPRAVPAYSVYQPRRAVGEYTDDELIKKVKNCIGMDCQDCTWLHGCKYGIEFVNRGLRIEHSRRRKKKETAG